MKILIFYQYFTTPKGSWGTRIYEFARHWVKQGHEVEVVTSIYVKSDLSAKHLIETQYHDGIKVTVINVKIDNKQPFLKRVWSFIVYAFMSSFYAIWRKPDITIASSGPITVGLPGLLSKWLRSVRFVFEVRDLWPEGAIELGIIRNKTLIRLSRWFEKTLYNNARLVVGLSPGMRDYVIDNFKHPNVISVTNSANLKLFGTPQSISTEDPIFHRKYAIYTGNIGEVNNSYWLLNACRELKKMNREDIAILFIGEGQQREAICKLARKEGLKSFEYRSLMPKTNLVAYVQQSMVSLVPLKGTPVLDTSSPNKFFESLAAGVPVIQNTNGWMKNYLEENRVGFTLSPENPEALAQKLVELADNPEISAEMQARAKACAKRDFDQEKLSEKYLNALKQL